MIEEDKKDVHISVLVTQQERKEFQDICKKEHRRMSSYIRLLINNEIDKHRNNEVYNA